MTTTAKRNQQLNIIVPALIGAVEFARWANLTFFVPVNDALTFLQTPGDPFLLPYHIVPQRLTFSDLQQFKLHTRIRTLLPSKFILITNNSESNFTIGKSRIIYPDVYANDAFIVHGVNKVLDYSVYGSADHPLFSPPPKTVAASPTKPESGMPLLVPDGLNTASNSTTTSSPDEELRLIVTAILFLVLMWR